MIVLILLNGLLCLLEGLIIGNEKCKSTCLLQQIEDGSIGTTDLFSNVLSNRKERSNVRSIQGGRQIPRRSKDTVDSVQEKVLVRERVDDRNILAA